MRYWFRALTLTVLVAASIVADDLDEYQVKAAFISNFANFVDWPPESFKTPQDPINICVLGRNPFGPALAHLLAGKVVNDRKTELHEIEDATDAQACQILFISSSEHLRFREILNSLRERSILTVGDTSDFLSEGGVTNLRLDRGKVRIEISSAAAHANNLHINARLLALAKVIQ